MPNGTANIVERYIGVASKGQALDIACGKGRNTHFMAEHGFSVDAVDYSDYALSFLENRPDIHPIEADLDHYTIAPESYDLIVNCYYLERRLFPQIINGLKKGGVLIFETYIEADGEEYHQPSNPDFMLKRNELLKAFMDLDVIYYEEREDVNLRDEKVKVASLVAQMPLA